MGHPVPLTKEQIKALRKQLGENTRTFGARFSRSSRAVEEWEQGRRAPDPLVMQMLLQLKRQST